MSSTTNIPLEISYHGADQNPGLHPLQEQTLGNVDQSPAFPAQHILSERAQQPEDLSSSAPAPVFVP
jgi:hypothetical protein